MNVVRGDARALPLPDASVDLIVTSPPYFALRSYTDNGQHYDGQIGSEATPREYIASLVDCTREWMRVLKPGGSIWVNLGDKYDSGTTTGRVNPGTVKDGQGQGWYQGTPRWTGGRPKSLVLLPERYRIACVDELGLIARAVVIWSKPNGLPESVTDRVRRSHEDWVHLVKQPRYYSAVDEIREEHSPVSIARSGRNRFAIDRSQEGVGPPNTVNPQQACNPLGKLPGSVWTIPTEPLTVPDHLGVDHFAAFPTEWPRRIILGWSPSGICTECGEGRRPVADRSAVPHWKGGSIGTDALRGDLSGMKFGNGAARFNYEVTITGEACACPVHPPLVAPSAPTRPSVVLDPFGGTGTTALVARALGRIGISVDRSWDYSRLARWRTSDPGQLAKAMRVERPPVQHIGQLDLFGEVAS